MFKHRFIWAALCPLLFSLLGCTSSATVEPTAAPLPTATAEPLPTATQPPPTDAPTLVPSPTAAPEVVYEVGPVLASVITGDCIDACIGHVAGAYPSIVLYADGRVVTNDFENLYQGQLSNEQMCQFLGAAAETGFFEFDTAAYDQKNQAFGRLAAIYNIALTDGTRSQSVSLHGPNDYMPGGSLEGEIDVTAISNTLTLINQYRPLATAPYQPERIAVIMVQTDDQFYTGGIPIESFGEWPLTAVPLVDLFANAAVKEYGDREAILTGAEAQAVYELFGQPQNQFNSRLYSENGVSYGVSIVPLFPYQSSAGEVGRTITLPAADLAQPAQIVCSLP